MKIEIAEPGRMTQSGSSLLKLIQNNNMPILDLLVRESIQNSLDAGNKSDSHVLVEFLTGEFEKEKLNKELEGITNSLNKKYNKNKCKFIAVRDSKTIGLTGKLHYSEVEDNDYGNLLKLIYEISKPQEAEGAGGSWGLGKTVYFRVGIGLVIYYSRVVNEYGKYESRLAASLVEDELKQGSLIPKLEGKSKRGIAWWGEEIGENKTRPITNERYIKEILEIFNIKPYINKETGTTIIIPYINEDKLLDDNTIEYKDGENYTIRPFWRGKIEEYIKIAVQRWYIPRLNNKNYPNGKFLKVKINENEISSNEIEPAFKIIQALYNRAIGVNCKGDILDNKNVYSKSEIIKLRKVLNETNAGTIAFTKVPRKLLKTSPPNNKPEPYMYFNCEIRNKEKNKPVICFTRKPGMIVSYEDVGRWVDSINSSNSDEFIFGIFVLNSKNYLTEIEPKYSLEEYIRKSEMADHTSWGDFSIGSLNPRIVSKVQSQVNNKISKEFFEDDKEDDNKINSGLGKVLGDLLLPPENFGRRASFPPKSNTGNGNHIEKHRNITIKYNNSKTEYSMNKMTVHFDIKSNNKIDKFGIKMAIDSENGKISVKDWEFKMGMEMPFKIEMCEINIKKYDDKKVNSVLFTDDKKDRDECENGALELIKSDEKTGMAVRFTMNEKHKFEMDMKITLGLIRKDLKPLFIIEKEEGGK